jgi:CubicO group peptidase (beta-lactamase class C family)
MRTWIALFVVAACSVAVPPSPIVPLAAIYRFIGGQGPERGGSSAGQGASAFTADRRERLVSAFADIDKILADYARSVHAPGAAWGIVIDGELAHQGTAGVRDVRSKAPVDADTVFRIASMTKSFTAMSILKLRDEGKLSLDDPAERYVPEMKSLRYPTTDSPRITIRHLLTHSEGFPEDNPWGDQQLSESEAELSRMLRSGIPFSNAPGVAYEYSNYGFAILGRIVSRVSGLSYDDYVTRNILAPLGMSSTTLHPSKVAPNRLAIGYRWEDEQWKEEPALPHGSFGAMGGMLTSVRDLSRYVGVLLEAWPPRDGPETGPVSRASLREMQQPWRPSGTRVVLDKSTHATHLTSTSYGYGLSVTQTCQYRAVVAHGGGLPGYGSLMRWLPDYGVGIIAFGNVTYTGWNNAVGAAIDRLDRTGGLQRREVRPSAALVAARDDVSRLVAQWDDVLADRIAAENLFLDRSKDRRRKEIDDLRAKVGACAAPAKFDVVENALRGQWTMSCERGALQVAITLAPTMPPGVQYMAIRPSPAQPPPAGPCVSF